MTAVDIIKNNQNELELEDFTTLLVSIDQGDLQERAELIKVFSMLQEAGVEPFNQYEGSYAFRRTVMLGCEVLNPDKATTGYLITEAVYKDEWGRYRDLLELLGLSFIHLEDKFDSHIDTYYLVYWTKGGDWEDKLLYWKDLFGGTWREIK